MTGFIWNVHSSRKSTRVVKFLTVTFLLLVRISSEACYANTDAVPEYNLFRCNDVDSVAVGVADYAASLNDHVAVSPTKKRADVCLVFFLVDELTAAGGSRDG